MSNPASVEYTPDCYQIISAVCNDVFTVSVSNNKFVFMISLLHKTKPCNGAGRQTIYNLRSESMYTNSQSIWTINSCDDYIRLDAGSPSFSTSRVPCYPVFQVAPPYLNTNTDRQTPFFSSQVLS